MNCEYKERLHINTNDRERSHDYLICLHSSVASVCTAHSHHIALHQPTVRLFAHDFIFQASLLFPASSFTDFCVEWANAWCSLRAPAFLMHVISHIQSHSSWPKLCWLRFQWNLLNFTFRFMITFIYRYYFTFLWIF